ncbi:hypothetical protein D6D12_06213 [Aureobasidium pullulans]|uniref:C2H2-type domain-containing protein n=1 Tax=Aureobasidium pullulans TaxID=5580 RepID=A0AB74JQ36_AURPU|nr:hypothetical protein D6D12_06213 [Aureobasidium pullulans]THX48806.1 hypothetical protein D6D11_05909 [Aureobasidium pullulans]
MAYHCSQCVHPPFATKGNMATHLGCKNIPGHDMGPYLCQFPGCGQRAVRDNGRATVHGGHPPSTWARDPQLAAGLSVAADNCFGPPTAAPPPPPPPPPPIAVVAAPAGGQGQANIPVAIQVQVGPSAPALNVPAAQANLPVVIQAPVIPVAQGNRPAVDQDDEDIDNFVDQSGGPVVVQDLWVETHAQWDEQGLSVPLEQQQESNDRRYAIEQGWELKD